MTRQTSQVWIGTSSSQYNHWKGIFYPENLPQKNWFLHYRDHLKTMEINNTFYNRSIIDFTAETTAGNILTRNSVGWLIG